MSLGNVGIKRYYNRPFPSCLVPLFQSESCCVAFHMKMSFHSHADKTHFHMKGFARGLALKKRHKKIRQWPILKLFHGRSVPRVFFSKFHLT